MGTLVRLLLLFAFVFLCLNASGLWGQRITDLKNKALAGDVDSQLQLGFIYSKGPREDRKEAHYWMTMAAGKGMLSACRYLGFAYLEGKGTAQNKNLARKWFGMGSRKGDTLSMIGLAECLSKQEERIESAAWLLLAKDLGEPRSLWRLEQSMTRLNTMEKKKAKDEAIKLKTTIPTGSSRQARKPFLMKKSSLTLQDGSSYRGQRKTNYPTGLAKGFPQMEKFIKDPSGTERRRDTEPCFPPKDSLSTKAFGQKETRSTLCLKQRKKNRKID